MKRFEVTGYHKGGALMPMNGGTLIITESEYIIKNTLFITVAKYKIDKTLASKISFISKGINLNDGEKEIDLYFFSKTAEEVYELLNLN